MLSEERVDEIFKAMDQYVLELANDPSALGPSYFQDIIATCRNYLNRVSLVVSEINRDRLSVSSELRQLEAAYALEYDEHLANSDRVRYLASVEDRKATVNFMLRDQQVRINELKDEMHQLDAVYKVVSYRNRELHATMTAIKDQRRLMKIEVESGSFYGDERVRGYRSPDGGMEVEDLGEKELAEMLEEPDEPEQPSELAEQPSEEPETEPEKPEPEGEVTEEEVLDFLDSPEEPVKPAQPVVEPEPDTTSNSTVEDVLALLDEV
jgi:hypothetical protein